MVTKKVLGLEVLELDDTVYEYVDVPEWKGRIRVRSLSGAERDAYEMSIIRNVNGKISLHADNMRARLIAQSWVDEEGNRVIPDDKIKELGKKSGAALDRIYTVCQRISGLENESVNKALEGFLAPQGNGSITN